MRRLLCLAVLLLLLLATQLAATTYVMMRDEDLADQSPVIVHGQIAAVEMPAATGPVVTRYWLRVQQVLKGSLLDEAIVVRVPGGVRPDGLGLKVWGAPRFRVGEEVLLFLTPKADGTYGILHLMLGAFHRTSVQGVPIAVRDLSETREIRLPGRAPLPETRLGAGRDVPRNFERFARWLADRAAGIETAKDYFTELPTEGLQSKSEGFAVFEHEGTKLRWFVFDDGDSVTWRAHQSGASGMSHDEFQLFQDALAVWNDEPTTPISLVYGGTINGAFAGEDFEPGDEANPCTAGGCGLTDFDGVNTILWDDPNNEAIVEGTFSCTGGGTLAAGGPWFDAGVRGLWNGEEFIQILGADIITNQGAGCFFNGHQGKDGEEVFAHELGHTLGLDHSCGDPGLPSCFTNPGLADALMNASAHGDGRGGALAADDLAGIRFLYLPATAPCVADGDTLCLLNNRFEVEVDFRRPDEATQAGSAVSFADQTGLVWFNNPNNIELLIKMVNGCGENNHYWVFFSATTNFEFTVRVRDTLTGEVNSFFNPLGQVAAPVADIQAFATCP